MKRQLSNQLPYDAVRFIRRYKPHLRERLVAIVAEQVGHNAARPLTMQDLQTYLGAALDELEQQVEMDAELPLPDEGTARASMEDYRNGRWQTVEDALNGVS